MIPIPWYIKIPLAIALRAVLSYLQKRGVSQDVINKITEVLTFLGLLGGQNLNADHFEAVHPHCSGVACAPELKFS